MYIGKFEIFPPKTATFILFALGILFTSATVYAFVCFPKRDMFGDWVFMLAGIESLFLGVVSYSKQKKISRSCKQKNLICEYCNYDLQATPVRCPECGKRPSHLSRKG